MCDKTLIHVDTAIEELHEQIRLSEASDEQLKTLAKLFAERDEKVRAMAESDER